MAHEEVVPFMVGSEGALRALADDLPEGVFTTDLEGRVTYWNPAAERITGWSTEEAVGRNCSILAGDAVNGCSCGVGPLRCGLASQGRSSKTCSLRRKDGSFLRIVKNAVPLCAPGGAVVGAVESFTAAVEQATGAEACDVEAPVSDGSGDYRGLVGRHPAMKELYRTLELVAQSNATVMILGESGAGKERVAAAIHEASRRSEGPFVRVSCSALNENLLESELFGHVKGAFTGALRDRRGRFQEADGGTLLLDEIGDVSPAVQVKLLRVIEQREIERVGDSTPIKVAVRLLCATHRDLKAMVQAGRFRADLYFRLAVFPVRVPSLREHPEDIPELVERALARFGDVNGVRPRGVSAATFPQLLAYPWPGNVRELQNAVEFAALRAGPGEIVPEHLPEEIRRAAPDGPRAHPAKPTLDRAALLAELEATGWNRAEAARRLGISRVTLWKRLKAAGLSGPDGH